MHCAFLCFASTDGAARSFPCYSLFGLPRNKSTASSHRNQLLGERDSTWWGVRGDCSAHLNFFQTEKILLGLIRVQTLAACVKGRCFIHCAMPPQVTGLKLKKVNFICSLQFIPGTRIEPMAPKYFSTNLKNFRVSSSP